MIKSKASAAVSKQVKSTPVQPRRTMKVHTGLRVGYADVQAEPVAVEGYTPQYY